MRRRDFLNTLAAGAALVPLAARAQQKPTPVIGFLSGTKLPSTAKTALDAAFAQGLREVGYLEGQNVAIDYRWVGGYSALPAAAADLVSREVAVIVAASVLPAHAAKNATSTIPIVFFTGGIDPVADGLIASLARPGGNLTGISVMTVELTPKQLELLTELVGQGKALALLVNPNNVNAEPLIRDAQEAARARGLRLSVLKAGSIGEIDAAFATLVRQHIDALVVGSDAFFFSQRQQLADLAIRSRVPTISFAREFTASGGLISYGASIEAAFRQLGIYTGKILKGAKPVDLPVQQPTKFELVINLKTAKALGLTIPPLLLARADEVIE